MIFSGITRKCEMRNRRYDKHDQVGQESDDFLQAARIFSMMWSRSLPFNSVEAWPWPIRLYDDLEQVKGI